MSESRHHSRSETHDTQVSRLYRDGATEGPPPALDAAIRAAAANAVEPNLARPRRAALAPFGGRTRIVFSLAAVIVLTVSLVTWLPQRQMDDPAGVLRDIRVPARNKGVTAPAQSGASPLLELAPEASSTAATRAAETTAPPRMLSPSANEVAPLEKAIPLPLSPSGAGGEPATARTGRAVREVPALREEPAAVRPGQLNLDDARRKLLSSTPQQEPERPSAFSKLAPIANEETVPDLDPSSGATLHAPGAESRHAIRPSPGPSSQQIEERALMLPSGKDERVDQTAPAAATPSRNGASVEAKSDQSDAPSSAQPSPALTLPSFGAEPTAAGSAKTMDDTRASKPERQFDSAAAWLREIERLLEAGELDAAREAFGAFRQAHPTYSVPPEMLEQLRM